jgi:ubiquinone/menaquinone biosynthesis C-methylase UbiE
MEKILKAVSYPPSIVNFALEKVISTSSNPLWRLASGQRQAQVMPKVTLQEGASSTVIDEFWANNTVYNPAVRSALQSRMNIEWRFRTHPLFRELTGLYGEHDGEVVLDYGCGPGNDVSGFVVHSKASKIIGMDISPKALAVAAQRVALHNPVKGRVELVQISDATPVIPLPDQSVDFVSSQGVLMHTSDPAAILREFHRVLKPRSRACVMVYSRPSIWFDLYTAYEQIIINNAFPGLDLEQAFTGNTDGRDCPMSRCFPTEQFVQMCRAAGFECDYVGGYLTQAEMFSLRRYRQQALDDPRLGDSHKQFLRELTFDRRGLPMYEGRYAGVSGVYQVTR